MTAEIISIGDELLVGQVVNTNAAWLAQQLNHAGIPVRQITVVADDGAEIRQSLEMAFSRSDLILMTGGLGPTRDDITKQVLCEYFETHLVFHQPSFDHIQRLFATRNARLNEQNRKQAEVPANCIPLHNEHGTAPGMWFNKNGKYMVSLPGVPFEMESLVTREVIPRLEQMNNDRIIVNKTVLTQGVGESFLAELIREWEDDLPGHMKLAYLPQPGLVRLRLTAYGNDRPRLTAEVDERIDNLQKLIPDLVYGFGQDTLEGVVGKILSEKKLTLSTAESCTGGYIAHLITTVPGSSAYFTGSLVAYSNQVKEHWLGVPADTLQQHGAVSEAVVCEMAGAARIRFGTDVAVAVSGIAGPDGGSPEKPVGMVWIAVASTKRTLAKKFLFGEHRGRNIRRAALAALNMVRIEIQAL